MRPRQTGEQQVYREGEEPKTWPWEEQRRDQSNSGDEMADPAFKTGSRPLVRAFTCSGKFDWALSVAGVETSQPQASPQKRSSPSPPLPSRVHQPLSTREAGVP